MEKQKEREWETTKVRMTVKVGQPERDGQKVTGWSTSGKGVEQQRPAGMNNLERDSKQYDVHEMETSTQEKAVRDSDWCVPDKHVAKLGRMRGVDVGRGGKSGSLLIQRKRTETMIQHRIAWDQKNSPWNTTSATNAAAVRLMARSAREREIPPSRSQVYVLPA